MTTDIDGLIHLFGDSQGRAAAQRIDRSVGRLPGLDGLHLAEQAARGMARIPEEYCSSSIASFADHAQPKGHRHAC